MSNFFYWLTNTKWGIFAGCTFIYCVFVLALCIHNHRRERYIETYEEYAHAVIGMIVDKYKIPKEEYALLCALAYCAITSDDPQPEHEVNEDD